MSIRNKDLWAKKNFIVTSKCVKKDNVLPSMVVTVLLSDALLKLITTMPGPQATGSQCLLRQDTGSEDE